MLKPWPVVSRAACAFALAALLGLSFPLAASPVLDPAFGTNGTALHVFPNDGTLCGSGINAVNYVIAMRNGNSYADGQFVSGHVGIKCLPIYGYALAQYNRNGEPDITFGTQGIGPSNKNGKLIQRDNQLVGVGSNGLLRLNPDGSPEQGFVTDGAKGLDWFADATWTRLAQQADGKIVVAGMSGSSLAMVRFAADGMLDMTFNQSGVVLIPAPADVTEYFAGLALQSDGRIVLVSSSVFHAGAETQFTGISIARFESAGTADLSFGSGGRAIATASDALGPYGNYLANGVVIQPDGRLVTFGLENRLATADVASNVLLLGFTPSGARDGTFGVGGAVTVYPGGMSGSRFALAQPDGKLLVEIDDGSEGIDTIVRFNVNGSTDVSFGSAGALRPQSLPIVNSIALQADGNLLLGGSATDVPGSPYHHVFGVQRYVSGPMAAIEFYNASLDHYFMSMDPQEVGDLDIGVHSGWIRTGLSFLTYGSAASAAGTTANPVCRFFIPPQHGNSHFFSADPVECAIAVNKINTDPNFSGYLRETPNAFYIDLPDKVTGACPASTTPVYRLWNRGAASNHRYTTSVAVKEQMIAKGWMAEGYGPDAVDMCAPQ